jgi:hypothetical protein
MLMQHDYKLLWFLSMSCRDMGSRMNCISERVHSARVCSSVHEGSHVLAIQCPDSGFAKIMLMFHGNAI